MAITNLQQARQLYAMGQRVAKTMDGSRPGYRGRTDADTMSGSGYGAGSSSSRADSGGGGSNRENYISQQFFSPPAAPPLSGGEGGIDPGFQNALRKQQIRQNTLTQSQKPNYGQFFNTRVPTYQAPTLRNRMRDLGGGVLSLINPLAGLAFRGYNYFKDQAPRAFRNFKSTNTLEEFIDKMRGYGRTMPTYSNNPAFGGIESLGTGFNSFINPNETISSEDLGTVQQNIKDATGYDTILTKNYTKEDLEKAGANKGIFGANDQLEALQEYYEAIQKLSGPGSKFAPGNPTKAREFIKQQSDIPFGAGSYNIDMDLIPKDFLETQEDLQQQKAPIELLTT